MTRAAHRLHLSPSATSRALDRARRAFDDPLLVPRGRGLVATPTAEALLPKLSAWLEGLEQVVAAGDPFDAEHLRRSFTIRAGEAVLVALGAPLTAIVGAAAPSVRLQFQIETQEDMADIRDGSVDLAIGSYEDLTSDLGREALLDEGLVGVIRQGHPLADESHISLRDFAGLDHVVVSRRGRAHGAVDHRLAEHHLSRRVTAVVPSAVTALAMVARSDATTTVSAGFADMFAGPGGLHTFEPPVPTNRVTVMQVWHGRFTRDPSHAWLRRCVMQAVVRRADRSPTDPSTVSKVIAP